MADDSLTKMLGKLEHVVEKWLADFESAPVSTALKVVVLAWCVKQVRNAMWGRS